MIIIEYERRSYFVHARTWLWHRWTIAYVVWPDGRRWLIPAGYLQLGHQEFTKGTGYRFCGITVIVMRGRHERKHS
jgi:hypothetical protein